MLFKIYLFIYFLLDFYYMTILKKYKPKGVLITIQKDAIQLWDIESDYD